MPAVFHSFGNLPFDNESVNNLASCSANALCSCLKHKCREVVRTIGFISIQNIDEMK